jgi:hypothetical protein
VWAGASAALDRADAALASGETNAARQALEEALALAKELL